MPLEHDHKRMMLNNALPFSGSPDTEIFKPKVVTATGFLDERIWL
jgi:hypothetical protein